MMELAPTVRVAMGMEIMELLLLITEDIMEGMVVDVTTVEDMLVELVEVLTPNKVVVL